ncbi:MAG: DUF177 domain-containing protein [Bacteroidales bacterium]|nr:DUF177 domain-containing protein [Bacteroidales bacterium]
MNHPDQYQIEFIGLNSGTHLFEFQIGDKFFEQVQDTEITGGQVRVKVTMVKEERMMDLHLEINGMVRVACDRCNEMIDADVNGNERLIIKLGDRYFEESEDVQVIPDTAHQFDLSPFLYEYIHLLLPIRRVHAEDKDGKSQCNPMVMKKLKELSEQHTQDPRWEALKQLKKNR